MMSNDLLSKDCDTSGTESVVYKCPAGYDAEVFDQLPEDIKKEVAERKAGVAVCTW